MADRAAPTAKAPMAGRVRPKVFMAEHEPLAGRRQDVFLRHAHLLEADAHRIGPALTEFGDPPSHRYTLPIRFDHECADPVVLRLEVGGGEDGQVVGDAAVGHPVFGAVEDVIVAVASGQAADARDIRAQGGLRCGEADQLEIFYDQREVLLLQFVVGRKPQGFHAEGVVENRCRRAAGAGRGEFLGDGTFSSRP